MFNNLNRETIIIASIVAALVAVYYLYNETKQIRDDISTVKKGQQILAGQFMPAPINAPVNETVKKRVKIKKEPEVIEFETDDIEEN